MVTIEIRKDSNTKEEIAYSETILNNGNYALTVPFSLKDDSKVILSVHSEHNKKNRYKVHAKYPAVKLLSFKRTGDHIPKKMELTPVNKVHNGDFIEDIYGWSNIKVIDGVGVFDPSYDTLCKNRLPFILYKGKDYKVTFELSSFTKQKIQFVMTSDDDSKLISGTFDISGDGVKKKYSMDNLNVDKDCIATVGFSVEQRNAINKINIYNVKVEQLPEKANTAVTKDNLKAPEKDTSDSGEDIGGITPSILILTFLFSLAIIKYRIFDTIPVSFGKFIENVKIGVMILDISNKITYTNPAFLRLFSSVPVLNANGSITGFLDQLSEAVKNKNEFEVIKQKILSQRDLQHIEFYADLYTKKRYQINVQPILDHDTGYIGKIISFNDISRQKRLQDELALRNQKLEEYNVAVEDLAVTRERNRIARDIHDSISHELLTIVNLLDMCRINFEGNPDKALEELSLATSNTRKCILELRNSIYCLTHTGFENSKSSIKLIESLVSNFRKFGIQINLTLDGSFFDNALIWENIFRICQEALTNSLKHGKAKNIDILLKSQEKHIKLYIIDDGVGCKGISKGIGLKSMEQRVESINGTIIYGSGDDGGFNINISIPSPPHL